MWTAEAVLVCALVQLARPTEERTKPVRAGVASGVAIVRLVCIALWFVAASDIPTGAAPTPPQMPRVRSEYPRVVAAIALGIERSATFRRLIEAIDRSDGLVYIQEGRCGGSERACLHLSIVSGPHRVLRVLVDPSRIAGGELTASIGHELQHALEALENPRIRTTTDVFNRFLLIGPTDSGRFETLKAWRAGLAVHREACADPQAQHR